MTRESNLRPQNGPGRRRYTIKDQGSMDSGSRIGTHVLKKSSGCDYWKPSWNKTKTCIRIYPGWNPDDPTQFDAFRLSSAHLDFGDWVRSYPCVRNFGDPGITMLLHDPANEDAYDAQTNPCWILYRSIEEACKNGRGKPEWYPLREFANGRGRKLSKPGSLALVQCAIFQHNNKDFFNPDKGQPPRGGAPEDRTVVFELSISAAKTLFDLLEKKQVSETTVQYDDDDLSQYEYGDIVSLDQGAYVWIFEKGTALEDTKKVAPKSAFGGSRVSAGSNEKEVTGFDCAITQDFKGVPSEITEEAVDIVKSKVKLWDDILQFYNHEEQAHLLNGCFPASAILYAFKDHPEWIDATTRRSAVGAKTVDMGEGNQSEDGYSDEPPRSGGKAWGSRPAVARVVKQDSVVPTESIPDDEDEQLEDTKVVRDTENEDKEDTDDYDQPPVRAVQPEQAVEAVKDARSRSAARTRTSSLRK